MLIMKTKKEKIEKLDISSTWENVLPQYARLYSSLNEDGKKETLRRLATIGKIVDQCLKLKGGKKDV